MRHIFILLVFSFTLTGVFKEARGNPEKEFLTNKEIEKIQDAQEIDLRTKIYMEAAELRLRTAVERLMGKESEEGDPLEYFTPEDMLDGYYRILKSVMYNMDEAFQKPGSDRGKVRSALKTLRGATENMARELEVLKKMAEEKQKEELWNLVNKAIDITGGARVGADYGLSKMPAEPGKKTKNK